MATTTAQIIRRVDRLAQAVLAALDRLHDLRSGGDQEVCVWLLGNAAQIEAEARRVTADLVMTAKRSGASWADVGAAFGMTRQAAWERFGGQR